MNNAVDTVVRIHEPKTEVRSFLIGDIRGYTRFTQENGDEAAARLVARFVALVRSVVSTRGGHVVGVWGDQVLVVFESSRQAIRAAVELQAACAEEGAAEPRLPLHVGVGVDAGEAVVRDGEYRGAALNLAARLCSLAGPGEVLASEGITHLARKMEGLTYRKRGMMDFKGFAEPVQVIEVVPQDAGSAERQETEAAAEVEKQVEVRLPIGNFLGALPTGPLVGRDDEVRRMLSHVDAVEDGTGQFLLLSGEAGIGKTRLAQELTLKVRNRGFLVATGRCSESEQSVPYHPFLEALAAAYAATPPSLRPAVPRRWPYLAQLLPEARASADSPSWDDPEDQERLASEVVDYLVALTEVMPVALLLDDLHWADRPSLALLQHLVRQTRTQRLLLVGTYVDTDLTREHPLERMLRECWRESLADRIAVPRLSAEGTVNMLSAIIGDMRTSEEFGQFVHRRTRGNPSLIEGMVRALGGHYQLVREIGKGGMSRVFHAVDTKTGKDVAAKVMIAANEANLDGLLRFQQEGAVLSTLKHDNIVKVYGTFMEEHASCIVMELLDGRSLTEMLDAEELDLHRIKDLMRQVTSALACAHNHSIVHRDIKPDNIVVVGNDHVKVTDFGIAHIMRPSGGITRMTYVGMTPGTPLYMSPEQVKGEKVDGRADIYALGAVLYHAVTGRPPFDGEDPMHVALKHVNDVVRPPSQLNPDVPEDWEALILKALAKDPAERFQSAEAMQEAISALSTTREQPIYTRPVPLLFERALDATRVHRIPDAYDFWVQGRAKERTTDLEGALEDYRAGLALAPSGELRNDLALSTVRVIRALGNAREQAGDLEAALENYRTALALAPSGEVRDDLNTRIAKLTTRRKPRRIVPRHLTPLPKRRIPVALGALALVVAAITLSALHFRAPSAHQALAAKQSTPTQTMVKHATPTPQLVNLSSKSGQVFGPQAGTLSDGQWWTQQNLGHFLATARFYNPSKPGWSYGFWFRNVPGNQFRVTVSSKKEYDVYYHDMSGQSMDGMGADSQPMLHLLAHGSITSLNTAANASNTLTLWASGKRALLIVNGQALPSFDVSAKITSGDVAAVEETGSVLRFDNFAVWSLGQGVFTARTGQVSGANQSSYAGLNLRDFVAHAHFSNPSHPGWAYGFAFRNTSMGGNYRLVLTSEKRYILYLHDMHGDTMTASGPVAQGWVPDLNTSSRGMNAVMLLVAGKTAWLSVNGGDLIVLDVSKKVGSGDVGVITGPDSTASPIKYRDFALSPLPWSPEGSRTLGPPPAMGHM